MAQLFSLGDFRTTDFMIRHFPTLRGWIAFLLAVFAALLFPAICPPSYVQSGVGTFLAEPVRPAAWIVGAVLILVCALASAEAFRRGTFPDRIFAVIAVLLTVALMVEYFRLFGLTVHKSPNTALEPTPITLCCLRFGFPVGGSHRRRGSAFGR